MELSRWWRCRVVLGGVLVVVGLESGGAVWAGPAAPAPTHPARATLVASVLAARPGEPFLIGVHLELDDGWHVEGDPSGEGTAPTRVVWTALPGVALTPLPWPPVQTIRDAPGRPVTGYAGEVLFAAEVVIDPAVLSAGDVTISADALWMAQREVQVLGARHLSITLPLRATAEPDLSHFGLFEYFLPARPAPGGLATSEDAAAPDEGVAPQGEGAPIPASIEVLADGDTAATMEAAALLVSGAPDPEGGAVAGTDAVAEPAGDGGAEVLPPAGEVPSPDAASEAGGL